MDSVASSPFRHGSTVEEELAYYKAQYEQLELELQEFQASSKELEAELEKDVEASEKRERKLKEKVEGLGFEVEEWKGKHKQAKAEANNAQTTLQKEVTMLREANRNLHLQLRDTEVANDDYERQARNTTSSLEDLESKYNVAIERGVMLETEIRSGEQEREQLRIETQRLRDELSDLRVEADITVEKLRTAEATIEHLHNRNPIYLTQDTVLPRSPTSEVSRTTTSSPTMSTPPPAKSETSTGSGAPTPPSPPLSDASANPNSSTKTPVPFNRRSLVPDMGATPRPGPTGATRPRHSREISFASSTGTSSNRMGPPSRPGMMMPPDAMPRSSSLYQIKGLIGRMQKIEERVHSVRSKLPPPANSTPRASPRLSNRSSPRLGSRGSGTAPTSITMRSSTRKRLSSSTTSSSTKLEESISAGRSTTSPVKRLSFGAPQGVPADQSATSTSRPSSRASTTSHSTSHSLSHARPPSRSGTSSAASGTSSARTPSALGFHSTQPFAPARPGSSIGGNYSNLQMRGHRPSVSVTKSREVEDATPAPLARRATLDKSAIPTPTTLKRQSGGFSSSVYGRRPSIAGQHHDEAVPTSAETPRKLSDVGETY